MEKVRKIEYFQEFDPYPDENHQYFLCAVKMLKQVCDSGNLTNKEAENVLRNMLKDFCSGKISRSFFMKSMIPFFDIDPSIRSKFLSCFPQHLLIEMIDSGDDEHQIRTRQLIDQKNIESEKVGQPQFEVLFHQEKTKEILFHQEKTKEILFQDHDTFHMVDAAQGKLSSQDNILELPRESQELKISDIPSSLEHDSSPQIQTLASFFQPPKLSSDSRLSFSSTDPVSQSPGKKREIIVSGNLSRPVRVKSPLPRTQKSSLESRKLSRPQKLTSQSVKVHESLPKSQSKSSSAKVTSPSKSSSKTSSKPQRFQRILSPQTAQLRKTLSPVRIRTLSRKLFAKKRSRSLPENLNSLQQKSVSTENLTSPKSILKQSKSKLPFNLRSDMSSIKSQPPSNLAGVAPITDVSTLGQYTLNEPHPSAHASIEELSSRLEKLHISPQKLFNFPRNIKACNQAKQFPQ